MRTLCHVFSDEQTLLISTFVPKPEEMLGYNPAVGMKFTIGPPLHATPHVYEIIDISMEKRNGEKVWAWRVQQPHTLH